MERGSGSYHAELLVKQATDADGAYVGIVTPLAKLSSYPGADAHSVGWRAKGGLRHKHGSTVNLNLNLNLAKGGLRHKHGSTVAPAST